MGRTLAIAICTGMICFALSGCGDDAGDVDMIERPASEQQRERPQRFPGSGAPPGDEGLDVDDQPPPPGSP